MSTGTDFAAMVRKARHMSPRTRTYRDGFNMKDEVLDDIAASNNFPGYFNETRTALYSAAFPVLNAYLKHVKGGRIDGMTAYRIQMMSPWQFAGFLGEMIDAGITNNFEGEVFFQNMRKAQAA